MARTQGKDEMMTRKTDIKKKQKIKTNLTWSNSHTQRGSQPRLGKDRLYSELIPNESKPELPKRSRFSYLVTAEQKEF